MPTTSIPGVYPTTYGTDVSVRLVRENGHVTVHVLAPLYVQKEWVMPHGYAETFTDAQILRDSDFVRVLTRAYGQPHH